jgi:hypothetical protein
MLHTGSFAAFCPVSLSDQIDTLTNKWRMEMTISMDKQYRTRDGREVRIYAVDVDNSWPVHGARKDGDRWVVFAWKRDGRADNQTTSLDLIEVKPRIQREYWVNVYSNCTGVGHETKDSADFAANIEPRIACVKITIDCEEGEGL